MRRPWAGVLERVPAGPLRSLDSWQRRAVLTFVGILALVLLSSVLYHAVLVVFEGRSPTYASSLQTAVETHTGTGYGGDSPWETRAANLFVAAMDLSTFLLLFIVLPYVFAPVLEEAFSPVTPTSVDSEDHVVVCGFDQQSRRLVDELDRRGFEYVVVVRTEQQARELGADGVSVIYGDPTDPETLERACVDAARTVVVDTERERSASVVLAVEDVNDDVRTIVVVDHLRHESQLRYAGADQVLTPRHILGQRIAERVAAELSPRRSDTVVLAEDFAVLELTLSADQPHCGESIATVERETAVSVVGLWLDGTFVSDPDPETVVEEGTALLLAGREAALDAFEVDANRRQQQESAVVVVGHGIVGSTVVDELGQWTPCTVVDTSDDDRVDVVGDATREETLREAGVADAAALVVTLGDDDQSILSVLSASGVDSDLDIVARVNEAAAATKIRRAGADYVLNLTDISGRILAQAVLHEDIISYNRQLRIVRTGAMPYAGQQVGETAIAESGCIVLAIERAGALRTDVPPDLEIAADDRLFIIGRDEDIDQVAGQAAR